MTLGLRTLLGAVGLGREVPVQSWVYGLGLVLLGLVLLSLGLRTLLGVVGTDLTLESYGLCLVLEGLSPTVKGDRKVRPVISFTRERDSKSLASICIVFEHERSSHFDISHVIDLCCSL